ncbi:MAG: hypothetical protein DHS20C07_19040 [Methyloligella sp.]|nr:MAG: hypothetical protein DHS20C07_19040 [Methyloligella sp.]
MITGIIIILILAAIGVGFLAALFWKRAGEQREEIKCLQDSQIESPASETSKKVDWEPDDYKDLSDGVPVDVKTKFKKHNYKRFEKDELDELQQLNSKQLKQIGG